MDIRILDKPIVKVLEIGRSITGNEVFIENELYFFAPRSNGVHVFKMDKFNRTCSFITIHGDLPDELTIKDYLVLLKEKIVPSFIKKHENIYL